MRLAGKVAIITGAASGMGYAEVLAFAKEGAKLVIADLNYQVAIEVAQEVKDMGGQALALKVDVTDVKDIQHCIKETIGEFGKIDILINNAGVFDKYAPILDTTIEQWNAMIAVNLTSIFQFSKEVLPYMIAQHSGSIVNIASIAGLVAGKGGAAYTASKHGVIGLTKHSSSEYAKYGIKIKAICPGTIETPLIKDVIKNIPIEPIPARKFGKPEEVAALAVFLASDEASFMNGVSVPIDGGFTIQ